MLKLSSEFSFGPGSQVNPQYIVPMTWHISYSSYLKGGPNPGKIYFSELLNKEEELDTNLKENIDFVLVPQIKWEYFLDNFGSLGEIPYSPRGSVYRKLNVSVSEVCTERFQTDKLAFSPGIQLKLKQQKKIKGKKNSILSVNPNTTLGSFHGSDGFNSVLQLLFSIPQLIQFSLSPEIHKFNANEFILKFAMIFIAAYHLHSGTVNSQVLYQDIRNIEKNPVYILQYLINRVEIESSKHFSPFLVCTGNLLQEVDCCVCGLHQEFITKFTYLNFTYKKTVMKAYEDFICKKREKRFCVGCQGEMDVEVQRTVGNFPEFLIVCLRCDGEEAKRSIRVECLWRVVGEFRLVAVVCKASQGFQCYARRGKEWLRYFDEKCERVNKFPKVAIKASVLLYNKCL